MAKKDLPAVSWDAKEYIIRDKNHWWYFGLIAIGLILAGIAVWLEAWTFIVVIALSVIALIIYSVRPPRVMHYSLEQNTLQEGERKYELVNFKSFGILKEDKNFAIVLTPRKRFSSRVTVFFPEQQGEKIVDAFGARLPMEEANLDMIDKITKFLRI